MGCFAHNRGGKCFLNRDYGDCTGGKSFDLGAETSFNKKIAGR